MNQGPIIFHNSGDFKQTDTWLRRLLRLDPSSIMARYGKMGVERLAAATPVDTGKTAASWSYRIESSAVGEYRIVWENSNLDRDGTPVALLIQLGHGTKGGTFVQGRDFISPAIVPVLEELGNELWKEVARVGGSS